MIWIMAISIISFMVLHFIVLADMLRKHTGWGCLGILFFPATLVWVLTNYSGKKKLVASLLYGSLAVCCLSSYIHTVSAKATLKPFFANLQEETETSCYFPGTTSWQDGLTVYLVWCHSPVVDNIKYRDVDEMVDRYQQELVEPLLDAYSKTLGEDEEIGVDIAIMSPSSIVACFRVQAPGAVTDSWHSGTEEPCGH